jgi:hypothetical protein
MHHDGMTRHLLHQNTLWELFNHMMNISCLKGSWGRSYREDGRENPKKTGNQNEESFSTFIITTHHIGVSFVMG